MPYRDDQAALEERRDDLRRELDQITEKAEQLRAAVQDQEAVARELAAVEERLARIQGRRVPLLEDVRIASPCNVSWDAMTGDDRVRFCGKCEKNVYNLSAMTREAAERLLAEREGSICVRLYKRADDTVITADCPVGLRRKYVRRVAISMAGAGALAAGGLYSSLACMQGDVGPPARVGMGAVAPAQEHYTDVALEPSSEHGLVLSYWRDDPAGKGPRHRWKVYADGRLVHEIGDVSHTGVAAAGEVDVSAVASIVGKAREITSRSVVVTEDYADSAVFEGFTLYGTGSRAGTASDVEGVHEAIRRMVMTSRL
jgi:hypothetical protein